MKLWIRELLDRDIDLIFYDLEFCKKYKKDGIASEIIQIGAVKVSNELKIISEFGALVKPSVDRLDKYCTRVTGIKIGDLAGEKPFCKVIEDFDEWVGEKEHYFFSWGSNDFSVLNAQLAEDRCEVEFISMNKDNHIDLLNEFVPCGFDALSLENALLLYDVNFENAHDALEDSKYLMMLFCKYIEDRSVINNYYTSFADSKIVSIRNKVKRSLNVPGKFKFPEDRYPLENAMSEIDKLQEVGFFKTSEGVEKLDEFNKLIKKLIALEFERR